MLSFFTDGSSTLNLNNDLKSPLFQAAIFQLFFAVSCMSAKLTIYNSKKGNTNLGDNFLEIINILAMQYFLSMIRNLIVHLHYESEVLVTKVRLAEWLSKPLAQQFTTLWGKALK